LAGATHPLSMAKARNIASHSDWNYDMCSPMSSDSAEEVKEVIAGKQDSDHAWLLSDDPDDG